MNEDRHKVYLGNRGKTTRNTGQPWTSSWVKPSGKFWKRYFNKKVRKGKRHKRGNWFEWS